MLLGEGFPINIVGQPHIEQPVLLLDEERFLTGQFHPLSAAVGLGIASLRRQHHAEPIADSFILDLHLVEDRQHLGFDVRFLHPDAWVILLRVTGTAVVDVFPDAGLRLLLDQFAGDGMAAVAAGHELPRVSQRGGVVDMPAQKSLHPVPGRPVDQRLMLARIPRTFVLDFAKVGPVLQDRVDRASGELRLRRAVDPALSIDLCNQSIEGDVLVSVEMENALDVGGFLGIGFDDAPAVLTDVTVAVGSGTAEPAFPNATGQSLADIDRLLFGVEAGHVGQRPPHHAASGRVLGRLRNRDERQVVFGLQPFQLDVIEEIASGAVYFVEEQAVEEGGVLLGVANQLAEGFAFVGLAGRLGNLEEFGDFAAGLGGVALERFFLYFEREALAFLFPTAYPCQPNELFHGDAPEERA